MISNLINSYVRYCTGSGMKFLQIAFYTLIAATGRGKRASLQRNDSGRLTTSTLVTLSSNINGLKQAILKNQVVTAQDHIPTFHNICQLQNVEINESFEDYVKSIDLNTLDLSSYFKLVKILAGTDLLETIACEEATEQTLLFFSSDQILSLILPAYLPFVDEDFLLQLMENVINFKDIKSLKIILFQRKLPADILELVLPMCLTEKDFAPALPAALAQNPTDFLFILESFGPRVRLSDIVSVVDIQFENIHFENMPNGLHCETLWFSEFFAMADELGMENFIRGYRALISPLDLLNLILSIATQAKTIKHSQNVLNAISLWIEMSETDFNDEMIGLVLSFCLLEFGGVINFGNVMRFIDPPPKAEIFTKPLNFEDAPDSWNKVYNFLATFTNEFVKQMTIVENRLLRNIPFNEFFLRAEDRVHFNKLAAWCDNTSVVFETFMNNMNSNDSFYLFHDILNSF